MLAMCLFDVSEMFFISASVRPDARIFSGSMYVISCMSCRTSVSAADTQNEGERETYMRRERLCERVNELLDARAVVGHLLVGRRGLAEAVLCAGGQRRDEVLLERLGGGREGRVLGDNKGRIELGVVHRVVDGLFPPATTLGQPA